jgi:hypothetical protein
MPKLRTVDSESVFSPASSCFSFFLLLINFLNHSSFDDKWCLLLAAMLLLLVAHTFVKLQLPQRQNRAMKAFLCKLEQSMLNSLVYMALYCEWLLQFFSWFHKGVWCVARLQSSHRPFHLLSNSNVDVTKSTRETTWITLNVISWILIVPHVWLLQRFIMGHQGPCRKRQRTERNGENTLPSPLRFNCLMTCRKKRQITLTLSSKKAEITRRRRCRRKFTFVKPRQPGVGGGLLPTLVRLDSSSYSLACRDYVACLLSITTSESNQTNTKSRVV